MTKRVTLEDIDALDKEMLTPADVASYLGVSQYSINIALKRGKNPFPFPAFMIGTRVKIPKHAFVIAMKGIQKNEE